nr:hypothetical protein RVX_3014 [Nitratidesulfovibrio sp. HK-II]
MADWLAPGPGGGTSSPRPGGWQACCASSSWSCSVSSRPASRTHGKPRRKSGLRSSPATGRKARPTPASATGKGRRGGAAWSCGSAAAINGPDCPD